MLPVLLFLALTVHLGPMGPDAPAHEPQMAANGSTVALTFGAGHAIYFSSSHDGGSTFSAPVKVAEAGIVPLTRHRGPRIAFAGGAIVITAVVGKNRAVHAHGLPSDGDLMVWRSLDGGKSWTKGRPSTMFPVADRRPACARFRWQRTIVAAWLDYSRRQRYQALRRPFPRWWRDVVEERPHL